MPSRKSCVEKQRSICRVVCLDNIDALLSENIRAVEFTVGFLDVLGQTNALQVSAKQGCDFYIGRLRAAKTFFLRRPFCLIAVSEASEDMQTRVESWWDRHNRTVGSTDISRTLAFHEHTIPQQGVPCQTATIFPVRSRPPSTRSSQPRHTYIFRKSSGCRPSTPFLLRPGSCTAPYLDHHHSPVL